MRKGVDGNTGVKGRNCIAKHFLIQLLNFATGGRERFMHRGTQIIYFELITVINIVREERKRQRER